MKHTDENKSAIGDRKRKWWAEIKKDPERLSALKEKMSKNNAKFFLGKNGNKNPSWKGGRYVDKRDGYVMINSPEHPNRRSDNYVLEHRLVMEKIIGRYLFPDEDVNHLNGKKDDNRPENLKLVRHFAHYEEMRCPKCEFTFLTR